MRSLLLAKRSAQRAAVVGRSQLFSTSTYRPLRVSTHFPSFAINRIDKAPAISSRRYFSAEGGGFFSGIRDKISGKMESRQEKLEKDNFDLYLKELLKIKKPFSMTKQKKLLNGMLTESGLDGESWKSYIPGVEKQEGVKMIRQQIAVIEALSDLEVSDPTKIDDDAKLRIAADSGQSLTSVNEFIQRYYQTKMMHKWLKRRNEEGKELPKTQTELQNLFQHPTEGGLDLNLMMQAAGGREKFMRYMKKEMARREKEDQM